MQAQTGSCDMLGSAGVCFEDKFSWGWETSLCLQNQLPSPRAVGSQKQGGEGEEESIQLGSTWLWI